MIFRFATLEDGPACAAIHRPYVETSACTFQCKPLTDEEFTAKIRGLYKQYPFLVAEEEGRVVGFAYASPLRPHDAYRWASELSIYLHPDCRGKGIGRRLYSRLIALCRATGLYNLYACITESNPESIAFHKAMGFVHLGDFPSCGYKLGAWHGVSWLCQMPAIYPEDPQPMIPVSGLSAVVKNTILQGSLEGKRLLFLGSSVTRGSANQGRSFADMLGESMGAVVHKEAVDGTTLADMENSYGRRLRTVSPAEPVDAMICQLSTNDAGRGLPMVAIEAGIRDIVNYARATWHCPVIFFTNPPFDSPVYADMVDLLKALANEMDFSVVDLWSESFLTSWMNDTEGKLMDDAVHPTEYGYRVLYLELMTTACLEALKAPDADIVDIDLTLCNSPHDLHAILADRLAFPNYYGMNADALYDCLTERVRPVILHFTGAAEDAGLAVELRRIESVLADCGGKIEWN